MYFPHKISLKKLCEQHFEKSPEINTAVIEYPVYVGFELSVIFIWGGNFNADSVNLQQHLTLHPQNPGREKECKYMHA